jgi:hypothetical protein
VPRNFSSARCGLHLHGSGSTGTRSTVLGAGDHDQREAGASRRELRLSANGVIAITGVGTLIVSAVAILLSLRGVRNQLWLHTFSEYTRRYAEVVVELPPAARNPRVEFDLMKLDAGERERLLNVVRSYLNLCSEEHYLHDKHRIDHQTWGIWTTGMEDMFRLGWFRQAWDELKDEYRLYPEFREFFGNRVPASAEALASARSPGSE